MNPDTLYPHNREAYEAVMNHFDSGNQKACIVHATGTGKSYVIGAVADHFSKVLVVAPNNYVIAQVQATVEREDVDYITYTQLMMDADKGHDDNNSYDLIVFDEFHRTGAKRWAEGVQHIMQRNPGAKVFGTSATPIRYLDNGRDIAEELFDGQVMSTLTVQDAWVQGILVPPVYIIALENFNKIKEDCLLKINSEYIPAEERPGMLQQLETAQLAWDQSGGVPGIIQDNISPHVKRIIVFCPSVESLEEDRKTIQDWFKQAGMRIAGTYVVESSRSEKDNMKEMEKFQQEEGGGVKVMFSINMLNEGVHVPRVDALLMLRRTVSMNIYLQQMGRCMAATGNNRTRPVILDLQNNIANVGAGNFFFLSDEEYFRSKTRYGYTGEDRNMTVKGVALDIANIIGIINNKYNDYRKFFDWNNNYAQAKAFFEENGHFPSYKEDMKLYHWAIYWMNNVYPKNPEENEEKAQMLRDIGYIYRTAKDRNESLWIDNYQEAMESCEQYGHFPSYKENPKIYCWVFAWWKRSYLKNPEANEEKAKMLREIGFEYQSVDVKNKNQWETNYNESKAFFEKHGHFPSSNQNHKLYDWAKNWWRNNYLADTEQQQEKADMLTAIGFKPIEHKKKSQLHEEMWMKNYEECKAFFDEHGRFPTIKENSHLYQWAKQWWILSYLKNPEQHQEKADMLNGVGYTYRTAVQMNEDKWMTKYLEAKALYDKNGHFPTVTESKTSKKWARQWLREIYASDPVKHQQKADMLRAIGLEIEEKALPRISSPSIIRQGTGYAIRCKMDGQQQMAKPITEKEYRQYEDLRQSGKQDDAEVFKRRLAEKYFKSDLSLEKEKSNIIRR